MRYVAVAVVSLPVGSLVGLSEAQAHRRRGLLRPMGDGSFVATSPIQLKAGEEFDFADELPKSMAEAMQSAASVAVSPKPVGKKPKASK